VEFEYDQKNLLYVRVGKRKFLASIFLRALGLWFGKESDGKLAKSDSHLEDGVKNASFTDEDILRTLYVTDEIRVEDGRLMVQIPEQGPSGLVGMKVDFDIKGRGPDPIVRSGKKSPLPPWRVCARQTSAKSKWRLRSLKALTQSLTSSTKRVAK